MFCHDISPILPGMDKQPIGPIWPVTCDHCGEVHLAADPLRAMFADAIREIPTDDEADRYEAEMEARHG